MDLLTQKVRRKKFGNAHALMKLRRSRTVWSKFMRATILREHDERNTPSTQEGPEPSAVCEADLYAGRWF